MFLHRCMQTKRGYTILILIVFFFLGISLSYWITLPPTKLPTCYPKRNVVFLKTHKCAGSTIQNILMRYGETHNLTFVLPPIANYLGHPEPFNRHQIAFPRLQSYNILAHHTRLNYSEINAIMPNDTLFITILREPVKLFESFFYFFGFDEKFGNIAGLLKIADNFPQGRFTKKLGFNQMMFDLGADPVIFNNETLVDQYVKQLEGWFDLVLITEKMDESLILLKELLCWEMEDIVAFKVNARSQRFKGNLTTEEKVKLRTLNHADVILYNIFLRIFQSKVKAFGDERMAEEISELREKTKEWFEACIDTKYEGKVETTGYYNARVEHFHTSVKNNTCEALVRPELDYTKLLRQKQLRRLFKTSEDGYNIKFTTRHDKQRNFVMN